METIAIYIILGLWTLMGTLILLLAMKRAIDEL
jgi:hypothetical protein